jgi:phenylacetate-CoA ligase
MTLTGRARALVYKSSIDARRRDYDGVSSESRIATQLTALNAEWARVIEVVPYYRRVVKSGQLPRRFDSLEDFAARVPVTTRVDVQAGLAERTSSGKAPDFRRMTGGSTSEPVQLPAWSSENSFTRSDTWWARSWYGLTPASKLYLLWGHSHLLGTGAMGWVRARRMELADRLVGYHRQSAYDMRPEKLAEAADALIRFRPDYMIGYSVALARFAAVNESRRAALRALGLKAVIGAAEAFPTPESADRLSDLFGCPVGMEYGSVETGLMGHTEPASDYRVFWRSYLIEAERNGAVWRLKVTSLYPRCFPLIRYDIGDEVTLRDGSADTVTGVTRIARVAGRCNDYVTLADGTLLHSEVFTHAVRPCPDVRAYQIVQGGGAVRIDYLADAPLSADAAAAILERLRRVHPALAAVPLSRVDDLRRTIAGKTRMVVTVEAGAKHAR